VAGRSGFTPARKIFASQVFHDVRMVELLEHAPVSPEMLYALSLISIHSDAVGIAPSTRAADFDCVRRHPPTFAARERNASWRTSACRQRLEVSLLCFHSHLLAVA